VTRLRQRMLDELQRRNYSSNTIRSYMHAVDEFARYFHKSPDQLGPDHIREYQVHLFRDCKLSPRTIEGQTAALRFLFVKTLGRSYLPDQILFPKCHMRLPTVLSQEDDHRCWNRDVRPGAGAYFSATPRRPTAEISLATTSPCPG
jgi:integrase/recombinase XerD